MHDESSAFVQLVERDDLGAQGVAPKQFEGAMLLDVDAMLRDELLQIGCLTNSDAAFGRALSSIQPRAIED
jgi:hypothetical protein